MTLSASQREMAWFITIGLTATGTHVVAALLTDRILSGSPLSANFAGYVAAVFVSYLGHARLTFRRPVRDAAQFLRFLAISLAALGLSQSLVLLLTGPFCLPLHLALLPVVVLIPIFTFTLSRAWAFIGRSHSE